MTQTSVIIAQIASRNWGPALEAVDKALADGPDDPGLLCTRAQCLINLGRAKEARTTLRRILELDPESHLGRFWSGVLEVTHGAPDKADAHFAKCLAQRPTDKATLNWSCRSASRAKNMVQMDLRTTALLEAWPSDSLSHTQRGLYLLRKGALTEADAAMRRALQLDPESDEALALMAHVHLQLDRPDDALHVAESALRKCPQSKSYQDLRKRAAHAAKMTRRWGRINTVLMRFGPAPVLFLALAVFLSGRVLLTFNAAEPVVDNRLIVYPMIVLVAGLFFAIEAHLKTTKIDPGKVELSSDY